METEGASWTKAKKVLDDALAAQEKRMAAEENARRQAEIDAANAERQKEIL